VKKLLITLIGSIVFALPAIAALGIGAAAPNFEAKASLNGEAFDYSLSEALKDGNVVVYFYPSAYTRGCNIQAHEFAENMDKFNEAGASVVGVPLDSIERWKDCSADPECWAGKLAVASDESGDIARSYDLSVRDAREGAEDSRGVEIGHGFAERMTFIVTSDGKIAASIGGVSPLENVEKALKAVRQLQ